MKLTIRSSTEAIEEARQWVALQLQAAGFDVDESWAVLLALTEVLSNVVRHAYGGDESGRVLLQLSFERERMEAAITHWGAPFDEGAYVPPNLDSPRGGGYGVFMVEVLMDEVQREEIEGGGTRIVLIKSRQKEQS